MVRVGDPTRALAAFVALEISIPEAVQVLRALHRSLHRGQQPIAHVVDRLAPAALHRVRHVVGHREAVDRTVGGVAVDGEVRIPWLTHARLQQAHLHAFLAQVVAVQVDAGGVAARAHQGWADLAGEMGDVQRAVGGADAVVAVGVEQRRHHQRHAREQVAVVAVQQIAHEHQHAFLALDLASVDAGDHQHHRQPRRLRLFRREVPVLRQHQQRQHAAFGRLAKIPDPHARIAPRRQRADEVHHIGMQRGLGVARALGAGQRWRGGRQGHRSLFVGAKSGF